jgi:hypothetical protein
MRELHDLLAKTSKNLESFVHPRVSIAWQDLDLVYRKVHNPSSDIEETIVGKKLGDVLTDRKEVDRLTKIKNKVIQTGEPYVEIVEITLGGRTHFYDISIEPVYDELGEMDGLMSVNIDMTDLVEAREQLKLANARLMGHLDEVLNLPEAPLKSFDHKTSSK